MPSSNGNAATRSPIKERQTFDRQEAFLATSRPNGTIRSAAKAADVHVSPGSAGSTVTCKVSGGGSMMPRRTTARPWRSKRSLRGRPWRSGSRSLVGGNEWSGEEVGNSLPQAGHPGESSYPCFKRASGRVKLHLIHGLAVLVVSAALPVQALQASTSETYNREYAELPIQREDLP